MLRRSISAYTLPPRGVPISHVSPLRGAPILSVSLNLPIELWEIIAVYLSLRSLSRAVIANSQLAAALLPQLHLRARELMAARIQNWWRRYRRCSFLEELDEMIRVRVGHLVQQQVPDSLMYLCMAADTQLGKLWMVTRNDTTLELLPRIPFVTTNCVPSPSPPLPTFLLPRTQDCAVGFEVAAKGLTQINFVSSNGTVLAKWRGTWPLTSKRILLNKPVLFIDFVFCDLLVTVNTGAKVTSIKYIGALLDNSNRNNLAIMGASAWLTIYPGKLWFNPRWTEARLASI
jgi:hypothetical protein